MTLDEFKEKLIELKLYCPQKNKMSPWFQRKAPKEIIDFIETYNFDFSLGDHVDYARALLMGRTENNKCKTCGKSTRLHRSAEEFSQYCSVICKNKSPEHMECAKNSINPGYLKECYIKKYGSLSPTKETIEKTKKTNMRKYGTENVMYNKDIKERHKKSLQGKQPNRSGTDHWTYKNHQEKYKFFENTLFNKEWCIYQHIELKKSILQIANDLKESLAKIGEYASHSYVHRVFTCMHNIEVKNLYTSIPQTEIQSFLNDLGIKNIEINTRSIISPKELDIYLPDQKIAIEYNGLYWHNDERHDKNYHLTKTSLCEERGIRLIHIFENEWLNSQDIVKSRLTTILGKAERIYARKCKVVKLSTCEASEFLKRTHIQGSVNSPINYGLLCGEKLVAVMTFSKARFSSKYEYELLRYSSELNTVVIGGASKLLNAFIKEYSPNSIGSYSDKRWNTGNLYSSIGFTHTHNSSPNYWYFNMEDAGRTLESRVKYQKHKLKDVLENFDPELSENDNMKNNGFLKVYDCGNSVWLWAADSTNTINS